MSISLEKRTEAATSSLVNLLKKEADKGIDLGELTAQIEIAIDFSGSMSHRYYGNPSEVQQAVERALALSLSGLDDDGIVPVHFFDDKAYKPIEATASNVGTLVSDFLSKNEMGGTNFSATMNAILKGGKSGLFGKKKEEKDQPPKLVLFITDGSPVDQSKSMEIIRAAADRPIFWQFIALGQGGVSFLKRMNTMGGRTVDNSGLTIFDNTANMTDEEFFNDIIGEFFTEWLPEARKLGITRK